MEEKKILCRKCGVEMKEEKVFFEYIGHSFQHPLPKCPVCGEVYIPESLVRGRMAEVEMQLEDK